MATNSFSRSLVYCQFLFLHRYLFFYYYLFCKTYIFKLYNKSFHEVNTLKKKTLIDNRFFIGTEQLTDFVCLVS